MAEILDIFDAQFKHIGQATRADAHQKGLWHQTFHCWIVRKRQDKIYVVFQKRSATKRDFPDLLDICVGGHMLAGETLRDGVRELEEEVGVHCAYEDLCYLGVRVECTDFGHFKNNEFQHVYLLRDDTPLDGYTLQEEEVSGLAEMELYQALALFSDEAECVQCACTRLGNGVCTTGVADVHKSDFVNRADGYYKKTLIMIERYFDGKKYLSV